MNQGLPKRQRRAGFLSHHLPPQQAPRRKLKLQGEFADEHTLHTKVPISKTFNDRVPPRTVCKLKPVTLCPSLGEDVRCYKIQEAGRLSL